MNQFASIIYGFELSVSSVVDSAWTQLDLHLRADHDD